MTTDSSVTRVIVPTRLIHLPRDGMRRDRENMASAFDVNRTRSPIFIAALACLSNHPAARVVKRRVAIAVGRRRAEAVASAVVIAALSVASVG